MKDLNSRRDELLERNKCQASFYDGRAAKSLNTNVITKLWVNRRDALDSFRKSIGINKTVYEFQRKWIGDVSSKNVLDLGCATGRNISIELAERSRRYTGLDLSDKQVQIFKSKLSKHGIEDAEVVSGDFLSTEYSWELFDIVFANAVMHHFEDFELLLSVLHKRLAQNGRVITWDPLDTSLLARFARMAYRPFQSDADWEWPFRKRNFELIERYFHIEAIQGALGLSKWAFIFGCLPFSRNISLSLGKRMHKRDLNCATGVSPKVWRCMEVCMCLRRRDVIIDIC